jgi:hypothetical protein
MAWMSARSCALQPRSQLTKRGKPSIPQYSATFTQDLSSILNNYLHGITEGH